MKKSKEPAKVKAHREEDQAHAADKARRAGISGPTSYGAMTDFKIDDDKKK